MKNRIQTIHIAAFAFGGLALIAGTATFADRGRGSIRAAAPAPREAMHEEPVRTGRDDHPAVRPEVHVEAHPAPAPVAARRDWDDNDEDARHFGGFAQGVAVHADRGQRLRALPPRNIHLHFHDHDYFLDDDGAYYEPQSDGEYLVVQPPVGVVVGAVPSAATAISVGPTTYWYLDGVFYVAQNGAFAVVNPPPGITVPSLPTGATQVVVNGTVVYQFNGFNYQPSIQDGVTVYTVNPA